MTKGWFRVTCHTSYPVPVRRPTLLDWASFRPHLTMTPLPFSLPLAPRKPGTRALTSLVLCHARHTHQLQRHATMRPRSSQIAPRRFHRVVACPLEALVRHYCLDIHCTRMRETAGPSALHWMSGVKSTTSMPSS